MTGSFWTSGAPIGALITALRCRVQEAAVSGLMAHHSTEMDHQQFGTVIAKLRRTVLMGDACDKQDMEEGGEKVTKHKAMTKRGAEKP